MKGTSKVIMGATLFMVVFLAVVLILVLVLLAELYCSLLLRRRKLRMNRNTASISSRAASLKQQEIPGQDIIDKACAGREHSIYMSSPICENDGRLSRLGTPFETPETSPTRLENGIYSPGEDDMIQSSVKGQELVPATFPLRDAKCMCILSSGTNSNNCVSSSSSGSPCIYP